MSAPAPPMPKKADRKPGDKDLVFRLPPEYGAILTAMKKKTGRPKTVSIQIAIERLARAEGYPFKPNWPEDA
jgi:predicted DNA-binding protein